MIKHFFWTTIAIVFVSLVLRVLFISVFPLFNDESIYIRWGVLMSKHEELRYASLGYFGKHPLPFWLFGSAAYLFQHPYAARLISLSLFVMSCIFFYHLLKRMNTSHAQRLFLLCVFCFSPLTLLFHSMALMESLIIPCMLLLILLSIAYTRSPRFVYIPFIVITVFLLLLLKYNTLLITGIFPLILCMQYWNGRHIQRILLHGMVYALLYTALLALFYTSLVSNTHEARKYVFTLQEVVQIPVMAWVRSLGLLVGGILFYSPVHILLIRKSRLTKESLLCIVLFFLSTFPIVLFGKIVSFRYFLPGVVFLYPLLIEATRYASKRIYALASGINIVLFLLFVFSPPLMFSFIPAHSVLTTERDYVFGRAGGYTARQLVTYLDAEYPTSILVVPDDPGNPIDYLHAWYAAQKRTIVIASSEEDLRQIAAVAVSVPVLYIDRGERISPDLKTRLSLNKTFYSLDKSSTIDVFKL